MCILMGKVDLLEKSEARESTCCDLTVGIDYSVSDR